MFATSGVLVSLRIVPFNMRKIWNRIKKRQLALAIFAGYVVVCQSCMTMRFSDKETREFFTGTKTAYSEKALKSDGHIIHYIATGNPKSPTLFFVHGSPGSWNAYRRYLTDTLLLRKFRMIAVDRPGYGFSDFGKAESLAENARLLSEVVKKTRNGQQLILVGHSIGGPIVVQMTADHPELVDKMVVLAGSVDPNEEAPEKWRKIIKLPPLRYLIPGAFRTSNDEVWLFKHELLLLEPRIQSISADVLVIHGTEDPLVPFGNSEFLRKKLTNANSFRLVPIAGANHFIPWEHYELIRQELLRL
ncbi:alpha/beta hydrolase [Flavobacterium sp.]|uniref:alpha/beta fold hydrolase n=1 Tax=Flavobacterium sp. TaxID=239 RepID=UPI0025C4FE9C|nr:alpha/beta hydrolase [Flavobacterium sp.]